MRATLRFALRSLLARRGRTALIAGAVAFAAALLVAMACGMATAERNIDARIDRLIGSVQVRVVHAFSQPFETDVLEQVRVLPDVEAAGARLNGFLTVVRADGAKDDDGRPLRTTVQARGLELTEDARLSPLPLSQGRRPEQVSEVVVDAATRRALRLELGDRLEVQRLGDPIELEVVGIYDRPELGALQRPLMYLDRGTLADALDREEDITAVVIILRDGVDVEAWCARHASALREPLLLEPAERVKTGLDREASNADVAFTLACMIGFLSCAFIVGTGLTTALAEQVREMGMLRAVGAGRGMLVASQLAAGALVGGAGVVAGLPLGLAVAALGAWWFQDLLPVGFVISPGGLIAAAAGALGAGVVGASFAAIAASRVSPLEALRVRAVPPRRGAVWIAVGIAVVLLVAQLGLLRIDDRDSRFWAYVYVGMPLLHLAWFLLSVPVLAGVAALLAPLLERTLRLPRRALRGAVAAAPFRLGLTAGALMVGVSIVVSVWSNGLGLMHEIVERVRFADAFVFKTTGIPPAAQERLRTIPGVRTTVPIGYLPVRVIGKQVFGAVGLGPTSVICVGFEPEAFFAMNRIEWVDGDPETALPKLRSGDAVLVAGEFLNARGYRVGDSITLGGARRQHEFEIAGVVSSAGLDVVTQFFGIRNIYLEQAVNCVFMDFDAVAKWFDVRDAVMVQMDLGPETTADVEQRVADEVVDRVPGAVFSSGRAIKESVIAIGRTALALSSVAAFAALLLASFGVGNVVAAGISARRREFGVVRAVGGSRGTIAGMVLGETALVAIAAIVSGTALGLQLAWMGRRLYFEMAGLDVAFIFPWSAAITGYVVVMLLALAAAALPLRSASRRTPRELLAAV